MNKKSFMWSDNWYIDDDIAWFVDGTHSILYQLNMTTDECKFVAGIPKRIDNQFRLNPMCIKKDNIVYCMPDFADCIWVYHIDKSQFTRIEIKNPNRVRLEIRNFWIEENKLIAVSRGLGNLLEIDITKQMVENYYDFGDTIRESIKVGNAILCVSAASNYIYEFNFVTKKRTKYILPQQISGLNTICFDGENYWLSGDKREVYVWNRLENSLEILDRFPQDFGIHCLDNSNEEILDCKTHEYNIPAFIDSVAAKNDIWFIPFKTNKIIYIEKYTHEIKKFDIPEEIRMTIGGNTLDHKYLLQYVLEERYIGLFSLEKNCVFEIDTEDKKIHWRACFIKDESLEKVSNILFEQNDFFSENNGVDGLLYRKILEDNYEIRGKVADNIGEKIYTSCLNNGY